jgi:hypothetical protein
MNMELKTIRLVLKQLEEKKTMQCLVLKRKRRRKRKKIRVVD